MAKEKAGREDEQARRRLEGIAAGLGAVLALGTIGIIVWDGVTGDGTPPIILVETLGVHEHENGFVLEFAVFNKGGDAAAQVMVEGSLNRDGAIVEASEATFDYVPENSRRIGGLFFSLDPADYQVELRATGYVTP
jgi:uncharacterized protein (TIGR02588 family)